MTYRTLLALLVLLAGQAKAGDWQQILGPDRNGIARDERIADEWPASGPAKLWEARIGSGFAGVAVSENIAVLFHREKAEDKLTAFESKTGDQLWSIGYPSSFRPDIVDDDGPRAVPTIHDGAIYAYSAQGNLYCVDLKSGAKLWERKTHKDFGAPAGYFGAGCAPLVENSLVIVNVGGDKAKAGIVAFDAETGNTVWASVNDQASYSAPVAITIDVLLTASYGIGAEWLRLGRQDVEVVWNDDILSSQYTTPILHNGAIYGIDGRQDGGPVELKCFEPESRKIYWSKSGMKYSTLIAAGENLLMMQTSGNLLSGTTRALPALANGRLYVRNEKTLICVDLAAH
jgi:outer membrane protein assembly factor BamB